MSSSETDMDTAERRYRVTLDFRLLLKPFTPEVGRENFFFNDRSASAGEPHLREDVERQRRLYTLLRDNERVLEQYLLTVVAQEAAGLVFGGLSEAFGVSDDEVLLAPLYAEMSEKDARYFEGCAGAGVLWESTELVAKAFEVEWAGAECAEMKRRVVGDLRGAGAVGRATTRLLKRLNS